MIELPSLLIVDDDLAVGEAFKRRSRGLFRVTAATDPKCALRLLSKGPKFAAILSDLYMPQTDGIAFLQAAKVIAPESRRYLFTGRVDHENLRAALKKAEIAGMFFKPLDALNILNVLGKETRPSWGLLSMLRSAMGRN